QLLPGAVVPATQPTLNYNTSSTQLSLTGVSGGSGTYSYVWQQSADGSNWTNILGITGTTYTPQNLTTPTYYRVAVTSNGVTNYSAIAFVNVYPQLVAGTIAPSSQAIAYNTTPVALTLSGTTGGNGS